MAFMQSLKSIHCKTSTKPESIPPAGLKETSLHLQSLHSPEDKKNEPSIYQQTAYENSEQLSTLDRTSTLLYGLGLSLIYSFHFIFAIPTTNLRSYYATSPEKKFVYLPQYLHRSLGNPQCKTVPRHCLFCQLLLGTFSSMPKTV